MGKWRLLLVSLIVAAALCAPSGAHGAALFSQTAALLSNEAQVVYLGNLERARVGVPPLRWNRELTHAARWFAWDSVENRSSVYCGHQDTNGDWPVDRFPFFGYIGGLSGAENAYCGYMSPQDAITGWMASDGHRGNILDPNSREIGVGYYLRSSDGRGYVVQDFGHDVLYPPVVIDNETVNTTSQQVDLYIYASEGSGPFDEDSPTTQMRISNTPCVEEASWQAYNPRASWSLLPGEGWRTVYVQTRDALGRTFTVSDTIYEGASAPAGELGDAQMSQTQSSVTIYNQPDAGTMGMQYSLGWAADDSYGNFGLLWGTGQRVNDAQAMGGTAFRMTPGDGESSAWVWTTDFYANMPAVAYFRLKVNQNTSSGEVARIEVDPGAGTPITYSLRGIDFKAAGAYQEFAIPFVFTPSQDDPFLSFNLWRSGQADVTFDVVTIFTASQPLASPNTLQFNLPMRYRGQTVWVRWVNKQGEFSPLVEGITHSLGLTVSTPSVAFLAGTGQVFPSQFSIALTQVCGSDPITVNGKPGWADVKIEGGLAVITPILQGLPVGNYQAALMFSVADHPELLPVQVNLQLQVSQDLHLMYLPMVKH